MNVRRPPVERIRSHGVVLERPRRMGRSRTIGWLVALVAGGVGVYFVVAPEREAPAGPADEGFRVLGEPVVLLQGGAVASPLPLELPGGSDSRTVSVLDVAATATGAPGSVEVALGCDDRMAPVRLEVAADDGTATQLVVVGADRSEVCLVGEGPVDVSVAAIAWLSGDHGLDDGIHRTTVDVVSALARGADGGVTPGVEVLDQPIVVADSRPDGATFDGRLQASGLRWAASTWAISTTRMREGAAPDAALVRVSAFGAGDGGISVRSPGQSADLGGNDVPELFSAAEQASSSTAIVPLDSSGILCATTAAPAHLVVEVLGWFDDGRPSADDPAAADCPGQELVPDHLLIAMYGTDRSASLGVLGEQGPDESAARLTELAEPWRRGDRPVVPAFELIATMATSDPGRDGKHRLVSSPEFVQRYLDVARRNGFYLILDIQPGWSDFLTEAKQYETFLRQPDVGLALDPEWKTVPPQPPQGGHIGRVDASEVNAVADWLATLVEEEDLPDKLLVVHQFAPAMVQRRELLREPDGVALVIHMDGFGGRGAKQDTYRKVRVEEPWHNGLKLFLDEDIDMYRPDEILGGAFDPMPVLVTYQ